MHVKVFTTQGNQGHHVDNPNNPISLPQGSWLVGARMSLLVRFLPTTACVCVCGRLLSYKVRQWLLASPGGTHHNLISFSALINWLWCHCFFRVGGGLLSWGYSLNLICGQLVLSGGQRGVPKKLLFLSCYLDFVRFQCLLDWLAPGFLFSLQALVFVFLYNYSYMKYNSGIAHILPGTYVNPYIDRPPVCYGGTCA